MKLETFKAGFWSGILAAAVYSVFTVAAVKLTPHREVMFAPLLLNAASIGSLTFLIAVVVGGIFSKINQE